MYTVIWNSTRNIPSTFTTNSWEKAFSLHNDLLKTFNDVRIRMNNGVELYL